MDNENKVSEKLIKIDENEYNITSDIEIEDLTTSSEKEESSTEAEYSLNGLFKYITTRNTKELGMLLIRVVIIVGILLLFRFPFDLITDLGLSLLNLFNIVVNYELLKIWNVVCDICYTIIALVMFYKLITTRYDNLIKNKIKKD